MPTLTAMKMASIWLKMGEAASLEYSNALVSWNYVIPCKSTSLRKDKLTFAFDIQDKMVAFAE